MPGDPLLLVTIAFSGPAARCGAPEDMLRDLLDFAYRSKRKKPACLDLLITGDGEMTALNRRHLGESASTDVLAFDDGEMDGSRLRLGDVAVNAEAAVRVAAERGIAFEHELAFYALHGLLHLLGMRDGDDADRAAMHRAQEKAMRDFGLDVRARLL